MPRGTTNGPRFGAGNPTPLRTTPATSVLLESTPAPKLGSSEPLITLSNESLKYSNSTDTCYIKYKCKKRIFGNSILGIVPLCGASTTNTMWVVIVQCLVLILALRINVVLADCWFDNETHLEGVEVSTAEPCLNCTCTRGALLCYLRICPQMPNPPPSGCILLHRHRICCPELICADPPMGNQIEARSDPDYKIDFPRRRIPALKYACISNGTIYAPGSAMDTSSQCKYCYCLGGEQQCVKPKCLAPLNGCVPRYDPNDCCPVHYNCTQSFYTTSSSTTTTVLPIEYDSRGGCVVESKFYPEGHKVLGFGHSICDNCYCIRGMIRCEPLSCAPALFGCLPVIKHGDCCPASYNCSGTIETHPLPNYGQFPVVSKEYAKLRKETQYKRTTSKFVPHYKKNSSTENTNSPYYVIAQSQNLKSTKSHKDFSYTESSRIINIETYTKDPYYVSINNRYNETKVKSTNGRLGIVEITYRPKYNNTIHVYQFSASDLDRNKSDTTSTNNVLGTTKNTLAEDRKIDPILSVDLFLEGRINRGIENGNTTTQESTTNSDLTTINDITTPIDENTDGTTVIALTTSDEIEDDRSSTDISTMETTLNSAKANTIDMESTTFDSNVSIILKTILNSTECVEENNSTSVTSTEGTTILAETVTTLGLISRDDDKVELRNAANFNDSENHGKIDNINTVLLNNISKAKEDDDYDYAEPTLPPSLPNLRIIPFVAADALESKNAIKKSDSYGGKSSNSHQAEEFPFAGIFSPPAETEGGFIPKEPLIITRHDYYTTTNNDRGGGSITTNPVPAITNAPKTQENNCIVDGRIITHEESITTEGSCSTCVCYFGSVVCHQPDCPIPKMGCKRQKDKFNDSNCCPKIICVEDESASSNHDEITTFNPRIDVVTVAEGILFTPRPINNVIRTEMSPSLHSLINEKGPYFSQKRTEISTMAVAPKIANNAKEKSSTIIPNTIEKSTQLTDQSFMYNTLITAGLKATITTTESSDEGFSLDKVWKLLFSSDVDETTTPKNIVIDSTTRKASMNPKSTTFRPSIVSDLLLPLEQLSFQSRDNVYDNMVRRQDYIIAPEQTTRINNNINNIGLLKLAGCNIYGRMYRVGRIISELSGPCLECKCTEIGVQCHPLQC